MFDELPLTHEALIDRDIDCEGVWDVPIMKSVVVSYRGKPTRHARDIAEHIIPTRVRHVHTEHPLNMPNAPWSAT